jgi:hypothetical protein
MVGFRSEIWEMLHLVENTSGLSPTARLVELPGDYIVAQVAAITNRPVSKSPATAFPI